MQRTSLKFFAALALAATSAACTQGNAKPADTAAAPNVVTITAADFNYQSPATIPAGMTTIRLVNNGTEMHHVQLVRLDDGHTVQELMQGMSGHDGPPPPWVHFVGGPNTPVPGGGVSEATLDLKAGTYAMLCFIPSKDGVPHVAKGMVKPLTVVAGEGAAAAAPVADLDMNLADYSFATNTELTAGRRTIKVQNVAVQPHEVVLVQLAPGKTLHDMMAWMMNENGPPPGRPVAGTTGLDRGEVNYITADFQPGEYALLCMLPDAKDGKPHIAHGMARQITVR
ncbi:hypothetical protein [Longimicrobium sp.]|uniref:hypothetical protein n=1 Tax=Longimicrobium sp. TaxID=2029185 RepID=UPI002F946F2A